MRQTICPSTALHPLGAPPGRKLLRVSSGPHAGREAVLFQAAPGEIACAWADRPYAGWSPPAAVTAQAEDSPFDAAIMPDGTIHLVYTEAGTGYLAARKLTLTGGAWVPGPPVTVVDRPIARYPSLAILPDGALWVCWTGIESGTHRLFAKSSSDGGTTWGAGPSDPGESLTLGASSAFGRLAVGPSDLYAAYTNGGMQLCVRSRPLGGGAWGTSTNLAAGENFDEHFDVAAGVDGRLGVVWDNGALRYREFDGDQWAPTVVLDGAGGSWPQLVFIDFAPLVVYLSESGAGQAMPLYTTRQGGAFVAPAALDGRAAPFAAVALYDTVSASWANLTAEATGTAPADIAHPVSGALLAHAGDALYLGMEERFRFAKVRLSSAGAGGSTVCSYWDGSAWAAITPASGPYNFDVLEHDLLLWNDYNTVPVDWQKKPVAGAVHFWVKIEALADFAAAPVGSQITAVSRVTALTVRR